MVPNGWERKPLCDVAEIRTGVAKGKSNLKDPIEVPYLRVANVQDGHIDLTQVKTIQIERSQLERYSLKAGDVLMTEGGDFDKLGRGDVWRGQINPCLNQNHVFAVRVKTSKLIPYYLASLSGSHYGKSYFLSCAKKSTNLASINSTQLKEFPVLIPPIEEQNKISQILSTWDKAIAATEQLLTNSLRQKKALMQNLLTGKERLPDFQEKWRKVALGEVFNRVTKKNTQHNTNVVTISGQHGLIRQEEFFKKTVASETLDGYFLLKNGQFAYNKSYSNGYPMGAIKRLNRYDYGVVTTLYICFELKDNSPADSDYFEHFFESGILNRGLTQIAHEGGRAHGLLNVKPADFFGLKIDLPPIKEQQKIASILNLADQEVRTLQIKVDCLKREKKALMQQLLTGKRRVQIATDFEHG
ncbi:type I restriction enzyme, S subunit [Microbulbifer donghaiensis]|uniref:Type I restriction enzyme, S subunit n=1 Tax=Microbulbifer donghaiensis TaxID=494016 RepID=A0A1M5IIH4_9GAMM|nr:restriction endonuclease subunit S [Microbulbifer donghaiensis]SHG28067.1 type I restriction enzyme, S subunit [Microbulbifer donghaiensis]